MAKEPTLEEIWKEFYYSEDPLLRKTADELAPHLSIREEKNSAVLSGDMGKVIGIGKILRRYTGSKNNFLNENDASDALHEIKNQYPKETRLVRMIEFYSINKTI
jgi:hypothetical protein